MSAREALMLLAFEVAYVICALVRAYSRRMRGLRTTLSCSCVDQLAPVVVDVRARVYVAVWGEEEITRGQELRAKDREV